jgi:hypothetical protein
MKPILFQQLVSLGFDEVGAFARTADIVSVMRAGYDREREAQSLAEM